MTLESAIRGVVSRKTENEELVPVEESYVEESSSEWAKSLETIAKKKQLDKISDKDKELLIKLAAMMKKESVELDESRTTEWIVTPIEGKPNPKRWINTEVKAKSATDAAKLGAKKMGMKPSDVRAVVKFPGDLGRFPESVELDEAKKDKGFVGNSDGSSWAVNIDDIKGGNQPRNLGWSIDNRTVIADFKKKAKKTYVGAKGKATLPAVKKALKMLGATQYFAQWKSDSSSYKDDSVEIWYKSDSIKESAELDESPMTTWIVTPITGKPNPKRWVSTEVKAKSATDAAKLGAKKMGMKPSDVTSVLKFAGDRGRFNESVELDEAVYRKGDTVLFYSGEMKNNKPVEDKGTVVDSNKKQTKVKVGSKVHTIDNEKIRGAVEESAKLDEAFEVGDSVMCKASGMEGEVVGIEGNSIKVEREDGKTMMYSPNELKALEDSEEDELEEDYYNVIYRDKEGKVQGEKRVGTKSAAEKLAKLGNSRDKVGGTYTVTLVRGRNEEVEMTEEKKIDPVNKKALKKDFDDRKDKDIDNDGDVDDSDEYLHNRRKAISKAISKESKKEKDSGKEAVDTSPTLDEEMTDEQKKKREEIVLSMKKKMPEFKAKYGDRAKDVMYATATKLAMKEGISVSEEAFSEIINK